MLSVQLVTWRALLLARLGALQASLDELLMPGEGMSEEAPAGERKGLPTWAIVLIIVGGVLLLCFLAFCVIFVLPLLGITGLTLMGPGIGNVFSNIIEELETPVP